MKKRIVIEVVGGILIFIIGIAISNFYSEKKINKSSDNNVSTINSQPDTTSKKTITDEDKTKTKTETPKDDNIIKLNEAYKVNTEYGNYNFTIKSATNTDWLDNYYNKDNQKVILLNLECENIDFSTKGRDGVSLYDAFIIRDNNGYILKRSEFDYDRAESGIHTIAPNSKIKVSMPYVAENDITSISVEFKRGGTIKDIPITK